MRAMLLSALWLVGCAQSVGVKNENPDLAQDLAAFLSNLVDFSGSDGGDFATGLPNDMHLATSTDMSGCVHIDPVFGPAGGPAQWPGAGSASYDSLDERFDLTQAGQTFVAGTVFYSVAQQVTGFHATFTIDIGGGSGADGMAFVILSSTSPNGFAPRANGGSLGFYGMDAWAVEFDTGQNPQLNDPSTNYVAFMHSTSASGTAVHVPGLYSTATPPLSSNSPHQIDVAFTGTSVTVTMDNATMFSGALPPSDPFVPGAYFFGFTGATGAGTDTHAVNNIHITSGGTGCS